MVQYFIFFYIFLPIAVRTNDIGSADEDEDFVKFTTTLTFEPYEWYKDIPVTILQNTDCEDLVQTFQLIVSSADACPSITDDTTIIRILPDDGT